MNQPAFPALLFAAGFGTRMKDLTKDRPKPLITVAGTPLIDHSLRLVKEAGCAPIVANLHYLAPMLETHLAPKGVLTVTEAPEILDTGGGLLNALPTLGQTTVVTVNSDAIWDGPNPIKALFEVWDPNRMDALLICVPMKNVHGHLGTGDFSLSATGQVSRGRDYVYGGIQIINTTILKKIGQTKFSLNLAWDLLMKNGRLFGASYPGTWCDVGHPDGIAQAETMLGYSNV